MDKKPSSSPSVGLTGASSFTGLWIANHLASQGFQVHALFTSDLQTYTGLKKTRIEHLNKRVTCHWGVRSEDDSMARWVSKHNPDIWIQHHHYMENFRSPSYNTQKSYEVGVKPLSSLIKSLKAGGCRGVVYTGSYFEPGEGNKKGGNPTPYAQSKLEVWNRVLDINKDFGLKTAKIVIPNPIGPFENEDRLIPHLIRSAISQTEVRISTPNSLADNLPISSLVNVYEQAVKNLLTESDGIKVYRPSGGALKNKDFVEMVVAELIKKRLHLASPKITFTPDSGSTTHYENNPLEKQPTNWTEFWDFYANEIKELFPQVGG